MTPATNVNAASGVYTHTTDLSQRISAASTSIGCIVGAAPKGPVMIPTLVTDYAEYKSKFGVNNGKNGYSSQSAKPFLNESNRMYMIRVVNGALTAGAYLTVDDPNAPDPVLSLNNFDDGVSNQPKGMLEPEKNLGFKATTPGVNNILGAFYVIDPGVWNNDVSIFVKPANPKGVPIRGRGHDTSHFYVEIYMNYTGSQFQQPVERFLVTRHDETDGNGKQLYIEDVINTKSNIVRYVDNKFCAEVEMIAYAQEHLDGGTDGSKPTDAQIIEAWNLIDDPEELDVNVMINNGYANVHVHRAMNTVAAQRGDALAILDMPEDMEDTADAVNYRRNLLNLNSDHCALYSSRVIVTDEDSGKRMTVPCSGYIAGAYAFTDKNRGTWFAPAGLNRGLLKVEGVTRTYDQGERDAFTDNQINSIRKIPGYGYAIWDEQTLEPEANAFQRVSVKRLVMFILKSASISAIHNVFDPNDTFLWTRLRSMVENFIKPIKRGRGVYDYSVRCDDKTNTYETIANGDVIVHIIVDPVISVRRIHIAFNINKTGSRATDLSAAA